MDNNFLKKSNFQLIGPMKVENEYLDKTAPTIFIDGGMKYFDLEFKSTFKAGDGDSFLQKDISWDRKFSSRKDFSDLKGVLGILPQEVEFLTLHGFSGGRFDHHFVNVLEVLSFLSFKKKCYVMMDGNTLFLSKGRWSLEFFGVFSLLHFKKTKIIIEGDAVYKVDDVIEPGSRTLSNEAKGPVTISVDAPFAIFSENFNWPLFRRFRENLNLLQKTDQG